MWNVAKTSDGKCAGDETSYFRYPNGVIPGNVIPVSKHQRVAGDTFFMKILSFSLGSLMILLCLCSTLYFFFSLLRIFYSDSLKTYKIRHLKSLGKYSKHFRRRDSGSSYGGSTLGEGGLSNRYPSMPTETESSAHDGTTEKATIRENSSAVSSATGKVHASTMSMTSPPERGVNERAMSYPSVGELMHQAQKLPSISKSSTSKEAYYSSTDSIVGGKFNYQTQTNKHGNVWSWTGGGNKKAPDTPMSDEFLARRRELRQIRSLDNMDSQNSKATSKSVSGTGQRDGTRDNETLSRSTSLPGKNIGHGISTSPSPFIAPDSKSTPHETSSPLHEEDDNRQTPKTRKKGRKTDKGSPEKSKMSRSELMSRYTFRDSSASGKKLFTQIPR